MADQDHPDFRKQDASDCNNAAWSLIEKADLQSGEITELLTLAATARHHWHAIGTPNHTAHADLLFAWAMARAGAGEAATDLAEKTLAVFDAAGAPWERAFAHAARAAAAEASGDRDAHETHHARAKALGETLEGPDATYFRAAFRTVPVPGSARS